MLDNYFNIDAFSLNQEEKNRILLDDLLSLTSMHYKKSIEYSKILCSINYNSSNVKKIKDIPMLPVRLFKLYKLKSISDEAVIKTLTSSGTTSQQVSKIFLDKITSRLQTKALVNIMKSFLGTKRLPMLIIDSKSVLKNRLSFSARGAGIMGMMNFGKDHTFLLNDDMKVDFKILDEFLEKHHGENILLFGFTFMVWQYFVQQIRNVETNYDLSNGIVVHSGGWKKMIDKAIDNDVFKLSIKKICGINKIHNFYGMVEQVGSIYVECEKGVLHTPIFSDIILRNLKTWETVGMGESGVIQTVSVLPQSYPGHSILTEDEGVILGVDDCRCGRQGKYFKITGRLPKAEIRGCSDTHES